MRWQRALNVLKSRQDGRISVGVKRPETEDARCATDFLHDRGTKWTRFCNQSTGILIVGEFVEPIMKRRHTTVDTQYPREPRVDIVQVSCLVTDHAELPKNHSIRN